MAHSVETKPKMICDQCGLEAFWPEEGVDLSDGSMDELDSIEERLVAEERYFQWQKARRETGTLALRRRMY